MFYETRLEPPTSRSEVQHANHRNTAAVKGRKPTIYCGEKPQSKDESKEQTQSTYDTGFGIQIKDILVGGKCS